EKCPARQKMLILDVCRFDPTRGTVRGAATRLSEDMQVALSDRPVGVQVMQACLPGQYSYESDLAGGSVFLSEVGKLQDAGGLKDVEQTVESALPRKALVDELEPAISKTAQKLFNRKQSIRCGGGEQKLELGYDPKAPKPGKI